SDEICFALPAVSRISKRFGTCCARFRALWGSPNGLGKRASLRGRFGWHFQRFPEFPRGLGPVARGFAHFGAAQMASGSARACAGDSAGISSGFPNFQEVWDLLRAVSRTLGQPKWPREAREPAREIRLAFPAVSRISKRFGTCCARFRALWGSPNGLGKRASPRGRFGWHFRRFPEFPR